MRQAPYLLDLHISDIAPANGSVGKFRIIVSNAISVFLRIEVNIYRSLDLLELAGIDGVVNDGQYIVILSAIVDHVQ